MHQLLRPLAVFACSSALSLAVLYAAGDEPARHPMVAAASSRTEHQLSRLRVLHEALAPVSESYVEPERIDPERMFVGALEAVERLVPEVMFDRDGSTLHVHVGEYRASLEIPPITDLQRLQRSLREIALLLERNLSPEDIPNDDPKIDPFAVIEFAMGNGMLSTLDPHSALLPPDQSREMDVENRSEFGGLGINIEIADDRLVVRKAFEGKPAALAGVRDGDVIRRIDGQSTVNLTIEEAVDLLRGPVGAPVTLEVMREGADAPQEIVVLRDNIKFNEVEGHPLGGGLGYVRIPSFHATVQHDLSTELKRLERAEGELTGLVLDLRDNPGGYLNQAIAVADIFLADGEIVSTRGPYDQRPTREEARATGTEADYPIVVLVNANSASASEIVAGALRNNQRAVIVGERTFGKGSVQNLHALAYDSKLKITIAHYLTPGEHSIQSVGIPADVEMVPATFGINPLTGRPDVMLFDRERVKREADLDEHLERFDLTEDQSTYRLVYRRTWEQATQGRRTFGPPVVAEDPELAFAIDLLRVAPAPRRGDMLAAAEPLVARHAAAWQAEIARSFAELGVDWTDGPPAQAPALDVRLRLGDEGVLVAGEETLVELTVTNQGAEPVHRLAAVLEDHAALEGLEFYFGRVAPGETRSWTRTVRLDHGFPSEVAAVTVRLRDGAGRDVASTGARVEVRGHPRPQLAWRWQVEAPPDGTVDVGDVVRIRLDVRNSGQGPSHGATARIRNRAGRALDVLTGTLAAGRMVDGSGAPCAVIEPGWEAGRVVGEADAAHPRVARRMPPVYAEGCRRVLAPGETWSGHFEVELLEALEGGYRVDLSLEDTAARDLGALGRENFAAYTRNREPIRFGLGVPAPGVAWREPPRIEIRVAPELEVHGGTVSLSGLVSDEDGLDHVVIFADDDKVFYEGTRTDEALPTITFDAGVELEPGLHTLTVLARDSKGFGTTVSHVVNRLPGTYRAGP